MRLLQVKQYNAEDMRKWNERVNEWRKSNDNSIIPQVAFVGFRLPNGEMRQRGWVAMSDDGRRAYYGSNQNEAESKWLKNNIPF